MPNSTTKPLIIPLVILSIIYAVSVLFFHYVEGWNFLDAAYYTTVTLATVGYGDFTPKSDLGKVGTIILIFTGVSTALYVITHLGLIRERTIDPHVQRRLEVLRNLTALQTGGVKKEELKKIREKINAKDEPAPKERDARSQGFGKL
ncbi:MAG: potassium channel family protein [Candidatus Micrarchaeota archaeon]